MKPFKKVSFLLVLVVLFLNGSCFNFGQNDDFFFPYDSSANAISAFLAGDTALLFEELQNRPQYALHRKEMKSGLKVFIEPSRKKVNSWIRKNDFLLSDTSTTLLYPFSGPDFMFADIFFPEKETYIMFGLEKIGSLPDFSRLDDSLTWAYLENLRNSLHYSNNNGYFVTRQMNDFFSDADLNGIIHILYTYLAQTGHKISSVRSVFINSEGNIEANEKPEKKRTQGVEIRFFKPHQYKLKTLYFFSIDVSNYNLSFHPEFEKFIKTKAPFSCYMKSASYLLPHDEFSLMRNLVLNNSTHILQDDSGIKYSDFLSAFDVHLYGTYSKTIKQFADLFQPDLKAAADSSARPLDFKMGYNKWLNETLLMLAVQKTDKNETVRITKKKEEKKVVTPKSNLVFKVQIGTSRNENDIERFTSVFPKAERFSENGLIKITVGNEKKYENCAELKEKARQNGFSDAFIIAFLNGRKISIQEALTEEQKIK